MSTSTKKQASLSFLQGGGEMGDLIRSYDWSTTPVGDLDAWPQSLRTTLGILIKSKFPMFLWWGPELICFYNDAYRPSLGNNGKHPAILGMPADKAWPEIWDIIKPLIDQVLQGGDSTWSEDQLIPIFRNGKIEDVYWTFSYSPVNDESGKVAGVLVTCNETTDKVLIRQKLEESKDQLEFALEAARLGTWDYNPLTNKFTANNRLKQWFGLHSDAEIELDDAINVIAEKDRQHTIDAIQQALNFSSGGNYDVEYSIINPLTKKEIVVEAKGRAWFNDDKIAYRFNGTLEAVTEKVNIRNRLEESEQRFRNIIKQAPMGITILNGREFMVEMANQTYLQLVDRKENDFVGRTLFESLPEVRQAVEPLLKEVLSSGVPYYGYEFPVNLHRYGKERVTYFNFVYYPMKEEDGSMSRIIVIATDVTPSVLAKHSVAESEKQFRTMVVHSPVAMAILRGKDHIIDIANKTLLDKLWRKNADDVLGKKLIDIFPELSEQKYAALLDQVYETGKVYSESAAVIYLHDEQGPTKFYIDFEYAPLYGTDNNITGIMITANDVTSQVRARHTVEESELRLRSFIESAPFPIGVYTGSEMWIQFANQSILDVWGKGKDVVGKKYADVLPELAGQGIYEQLDEVYKTGVPFHAHQQRVDLLIHDKLMPHYFNYSFTPLFDMNGEVYGVMNTAAEVTNLVTAQQRTEESEKKFRLLADSMPQHIWTGDINGRLNYFNLSVYTYSGLSPEQIDKDGWLQIVHPDDREANIEHWLHSVQSGEPFLFEHRFRRYDGEYRWQLSRALPVKDSSGNIQMWVGTSTDIDEIKKHQQEKDDFIKIASHELKTPVTTIKAYVQLLLSQDTTRQDTMLAKSLATIDRQITKLAKLIADLMDITKIELGSFEANKEEFYITELIRDIISSLQPTTTHHINFDEAAEIGVNADKDRISQVITNLLTNAIKYSPNADKVIVDITTTENELIVAVQDFGIGMGPKDHEKVFDRFYRAENPEGKIFPGFGIGLFIVKEIISNHKGKVWVKSEPNKGSSFYFSLPR